MMTQVAEQLETQLEVQATGRVQCDSCSARAMIVSILPYGELSFCMHHYNQHAQALTDQGGIAKLLSVTEDQIGNHMNFGKGGQNIVQAGTNNPNVFRGAGNVLGMFLGTKIRRAERDYNRQADEESRIRVNEASQMSRVKANMFEGLMQPHVATNYYDTAFKTLGADHPDVVAGDRQANEFERPEFARQVSKFGVVSGKHGVFPAATPAGVVQEEARRLRQTDESTKQKDAEEDYSGTVARFGKDGKITREKVSLEDITSGKKTSEMAPESFQEDVYDSTAPTNRPRSHWTPERLADLENERPRTNSLNDGINDGKGGNK